MKSWILGVALLGATGGGMAFVLASKGDPTPGPVSASVPTEHPRECPTCKQTPVATDMIDVSALLASTVDLNRPQVTFEEPAFAQPVKPVAASEVAPMPRTITEEAPMPRAG